MCASDSLHGWPRQTGRSSAPLVLSEPMCRDQFTRRACLDMLTQIRTPCHDGWEKEGFWALLVMTSMVGVPRGPKFTLMELGVLGFR